jgi:hypothetical protein
MVGGKRTFAFSNRRGLKKVGGFHFLVHPQWFTEKNSHFTKFCKVGGVGNDITSTFSTF